MSETTERRDERAESADRIVDAALTVLAREGIAGVTMRAVAREADVAVGLANYHFDNKSELIAAALREIGARDIELVTPDAEDDAAGQLRRSLRRAVDPVFLTPSYLSLRLQLWALADVEPLFAEINRAAQQRYLDGLTTLLIAARPDLEYDEAAARSADILIEQNGVWLTAILVFDAAAIERALARCEAIAFC